MTSPIITPPQPPPPPAPGLVGPGRLLTASQIGFGYFIRFVICQVVCGTLSIGTVLVAPKLFEVFKDFKTTLPPLSMFAVSFGDWVANQFGWIPLQLLPFFLPLPILLVEFTCDDQLARVLRRIYTGLLIVLFLLLVGMLATGYYLPFVKLAQSIRDGEPGGGG